jgi:hypothetical protein
VRAGLLGQQVWNLLAQLNFRDHDLDPILFDLCYEAMKLERRWLTPRLRLDRPDDLEPKASREVRPGWMMGDESPIDKARDPITQFRSKLVQFSKIRGLIGSIFRRMGWIYLNEGLRNMPHHGRRILRIHPYVRITSLVFFGGLGRAVMV